MDIGWYKDNIALQAELKREYPAVAELIDSLKAELEFEQFSANHNEEVVKERIAEVKALERQLAHKQEQCNQLAHEVLELEQQLARYQSKYNNLLAVAHRDGGQYLAQHGEEVAGEDAITAILTAYHNNDRYQGAVEVEGVVKSCHGAMDSIWVTFGLLKHFKDKKVRVLIMKLEG